MKHSVQVAWSWRLAIVLLVVCIVLVACGGADSAPDVTASADLEKTSVPAVPTADASPVSAATTPDLEGPSRDYYLHFDGRDDRVLVPWDESFPTEVFTVSAWIRLPEPPSRRAAIIARGEDDDSFNLSWQLYVVPEGNLEAMIESSNEQNYCYPDNDCVPFGTCESGDLFVADGLWHHVALSRDANGTLVFYIDGEELARCEGTGVPSSDNRQFLSLGATHGAIGRLEEGETEPPIWFFPGDIDAVSMWDRSLSAAEVG